MQMLGIFLATLAANAGTVIGGALGIFTVLLAFTARGRHLVSATVNFFFGKAENNPEIAAGLFDQKIRELRGVVVKAQRLFEQTSGEMQAAELEMERCRREFLSASENAKKAQGIGKTEEALLFASQARSAQRGYDLAAESQGKYADLARQARERLELANGNLRALESRKQEVITRMKTSATTQEIYDELNGLQVSALDDTLLRIGDAAQRAEAQALGSRAYFEESETVKTQRALQAIDEVDNAGYLATLLKASDVAGLLGKENDK